MTMSVFLLSSLFSLSFIHWNLDPELVRIGPLGIRYYSLCFLASFVVGAYIMRSIFSREGKSENDLNSLINYMVAATVVGARLGHCLFYDPQYYLSNPIEILKVWQGGLSSHGAAIGIFFALYMYIRTRPDQPYLWILDRIVITVALAGFFIRLGNLFNSEIVGIPTGVPWAIVFDRIDALPRHPTQVYESVAYGVVFLFLYRLYGRLGSETPSGLFLGLFLIFVFTFRFFVEFVKTRQAAFGHDLALSVGQILSIPLVLIGIAILVRIRTQTRSGSGTES